MKTSFLDRINADVLENYIAAVQSMIAALDSGDETRIAAARALRDASREAMQAEHDAYLLAAE